MNEIEKILIVDDNEASIQCALDLQNDRREIHIARDFGQAMSVLMGGSSMRELGEKNIQAPYRVVMTGMNFAYGPENNLADRSPAYTRMPLGFPLLFAAVQAKVPNIGMLTDMNHHDHPMANAFDFLYTQRDQEHFGNTDRPVFTVNSSKVVLCDERDIPGAYVHAQKVLRGWDEMKKYVAAQIGSTDYDRVRAWQDGNIKPGKNFFDLYMILTGQAQTKQGNGK